jgi:hypothetical protein
MDCKYNHNGKSLGDRSQIARRIRHVPTGQGLPLKGQKLLNLQNHIGTSEHQRQKKLEVRKSGKSPGTTDYYYFSSTGVKYRSIEEIERDSKHTVEVS